MLERKEPNRVLVVSGNENGSGYIISSLSPSDFEIVAPVNNSAEAKHRLAESAVDIVFVNAPLTDEFGVDFAIDTASGEENRVVILLVKNEIYEQVAYKTGRYGVLVLPKPVSRALMAQAINLAVATRERLKREEKKAQNLQKKMSDIKAIDRAKLILIEKFRLTEDDAHKYLENQAMNMRVSKTEIAYALIKTYET